MIQEIILNSTITCPQCGFRKDEIMPTDACQYFYKCTNCGLILKPKTGDCCVFCSYGSEKCPPIQESHNCRYCGWTDGFTHRTEIEIQYRWIYPSDCKPGITPTL